MVSTQGVRDRAAVLRQFIAAAVDGDPSGAEDLVTDDVVGWSPTLYVTSRRQLLDAFEDRDAALTNIDVQILSVDVIGDRAIGEWRASADFTGELRIGDRTFPPTGQPVRLAGATFADFDGARVRSFRHYFDDAALLEQLLALT